MEMDEITTKRLVLRAVELEDAADLLAAYGDHQALYGYDVRDAVYDIDELLDVLTQDMAYRKSRGLPPMLVLELKESGTVIGEIHFNRIIDGCGEIGYLLAKKYRHQGYMREAVKALVHVGFHVLGLERIEARYVRENQASAAVLKHCHFVYEGCLRQAVRLNDHRLHDMVICAILKTDDEADASMITTQKKTHLEI